MRERPVPQLTIQQLDYLVAVVDHETWAGAAASLGVTPSALSQGLAELERRLGIGLFERVGRRRLIAESGNPVVDYARGVLADTSSLARWLDATAEGSTGRLRVGMIDIAVTEHFTEILRSFVDDHPSIDLRLSVGPSTQLLADVVNDDLDLGVLVEPTGQLANVKMYPLLDEPLGVYGPHGCQGLPPAEWGPWVGFPPSSHTFGLIASSLAAIGVDYELVAESHQPEVLRQMVSLGLGWTVLPVSQAEGVDSAIARVSRRTLRMRRLSSARRISALPNPLAELLLNRLRSADPATLSQISHLGTS